jgi:hypothetical protein
MGFPRESPQSTRTCGARSRGGWSCRSRALYPNGRCHFHGGPSTGARTPEGLARALEALARGRATQKAARRAVSPAGRIEALAAQGLSLAAIVERTGLARDLVRQTILALAEGKPR